MPINKVIRPIVRGVYDLQKTRIAVGNRIGASFRAKLGLAPGQSKQEADAEAQKMLDEIARDYKLVCQGYAERGETVTSRNFAQFGHLESYVEFELVRDFHELLANETSYFGTLKRFIERERLWQEYLVDVRGVGPAITGVLLSEVDIYPARYASSLWALAGLDVAPDGRGRSRRKEHLVKRAYTNKEGKEEMRDSITFNPLLKTKLIGVLGPSFLKQPADACPYRRIYDDYKHRLEHHATWCETSKGHRHNAAVRYMIKMFLLDLWRAWRTMEGLPIPDPYREAKLGLPPHRRAA